MNSRWQISFRLMMIYIFAMLTVIGCPSRYRLDLFVINNNINKKVKVAQTRFFENTSISNPFADSKLIAGESNTAILTTTTRWKKGKTDISMIISFDEYWKAHLYLQLPHTMKTGKYEIEHKSFVQILGQYDIDPKEKIFLPTSGFYTIDSLISKKAFISISCDYKNSAGKSLGFNGKFKLKVAK